MIFFRFLSLSCDFNIAQDTIGWLACLFVCFYFLSLELPNNKTVILYNVGQIFWLPYVTAFLKALSRLFWKFKVIPWRCYCLHVVLCFFHTPGRVQIAARSTGF